MTDKVVFEDYFGFPEKNYFRSTSWWVNFNNEMTKRQNNKSQFETSSRFLNEMNKDLSQYQAAVQIDYVTCTITLTFDSPEDYFAFVMGWS
jgi:hypothetical protein